MHVGARVGREVQPRAGHVLDRIVQLRHVDRIGKRSAGSHVGDLVGAHIDAAAIDHRTTVVDGDTVADLDVVGQVERQACGTAANHDIVIRIAEIHRSARSHIGRCVPIGAHVPALRGVSDSVMHCVFARAANIGHGQAAIRGQSRVAA